MVLIPGMGCGEWIWQPVARRLRAAGHTAIAVTLPGTRFQDQRSGHTLESAIDWIIESIDKQQSDPVTIVCHSLGGYAGTGAALRLGPSRVAQVIYVSAVVPAAGVAMRDENDQYRALIDADIAENGTVSMTFDAVCSSLMQDEPTSTQRLVYELMVPTPSAYFTDSLTEVPANGNDINARYLLFGDDQSLARPGREFAARLGLTPEIIDGSHMAIFTRPEQLVETLTTR